MKKHTPLVLISLSAAFLCGEALAGAAPSKKPGAPVVARPPAAAPAEWQNLAKASMDKGLAWLASKEVDKKGYWGDPNFPGVTALALWAFVESGDKQYTPHIDRAVAYLLSCVHESGGIYKENPVRKGGGLSTYNTALCLTALHAARGSDPATLPVILKARAFLASSQVTGDDTYGGGFGYNRESPRPYADLNNTEFVLEAMRRTQGVEDLRPTGEKRVDIDWSAALKFVNSLQNMEGDDAGGFFYNATTAADKSPGTDGKPLLRTYGSITYAGLLSMIYANVSRDDPRVVSAVDYATRHWTLQENPGMDQQGLYYYINIMSRALAVSHLDALERKDGGGTIQWREETVRRLAAIQQADGSWFNTDNRFWEADPSLVTAYSLLALEFAAGLAK